MKYKHRQKFNIFKILSIILVIIFTLLIPTITLKLIKINKIECESQFGKCPQELELRINNYILSNYKAAKKQIEQQLTNDIQVNNYLIQYKIPSTLKIELNLKKPKYAVKDQNNKLYLIDKDGLIIEIVDESNLPILINNNITGKIGDKVSGRDKFALEILEKVTWLYSIREGIVEKEQLKIILKEGIIVRFPLEGDPDVLVGSLRLIFSRLNDMTNGIRIEEGVNLSNIKEIDLRFTNPVLR